MSQVWIREAFLTSIQVTGTVENDICADNLLVTIDCGSGSISKLADIDFFAPFPWPWSVEFTDADGLGNIQCSCEKNVEVRAVCEAAPSECIAQGTYIIQCGECPTVALSVSGHDDGDCEGGKNTVTLNAVHFDVVSPSAFWEYGDASPNGPPFTFSGGTIHPQNHDYLPGAYTARLHISGCGTEDISFVVDDCDPPIECPAINIAIKQAKLWG